MFAMLWMRVRFRVANRKPKLAGLPHHPPLGPDLASPAPFAHLLLLHLTLRTLMWMMKGMLAHAAPR